MNPEEEKNLFEKVKKGNVQSFETLFHRYYGNLCLFASGIIKDNHSAEEIIQDFFVKLWERKENLTIDTSIKNYFFRSIKNLCINHIKHNKIKEKYSQKEIAEQKTNYDFDEVFIEVDLVQKIEESINSLPERRREIFRLSREEGLKYQEIAQKLNISIKTVETQISLAIKHLREKLKNYHTFLLLFCAFIKN